MFSQFFIHRPKFAFVISILMMLAGFICLNMMPISEYPEVSPPTISVRMTYSGASAEEVAQVVAAPVEEQLIGMDDLQYFSSTCGSDGSYSLSLVFAAGTDDDTAQINVSNAIKAVESKLPDQIKQLGYNVRKRSGDLLCFVSFTCDENKMSVQELSNWLRMNIRDKVGQVEGVSSTNIIPNRDYAMRVWMNVVRMSQPRRCEQRHQRTKYPSRRRCGGLRRRGILRHLQGNGNGPPEDSGAVRRHHRQTR